MKACGAVAGALLAISVHASPCVCIFFICSWGCHFEVAAIGWCWCFFVFTPMAIFCGNNRHKGRHSGIQLSPARQHSASPPTRGRWSAPRGR